MARIIYPGDTLKEYREKAVALRKSFISAPAKDAPAAPPPVASTATQIPSGQQPGSQDPSFMQQGMQQQFGGPHSQTMGYNIYAMPPQLMYMPPNPGYIFPQMMQMQAQMQALGDHMAQIMSIMPKHPTSRAA